MTILRPGKVSIKHDYDGRSASLGTGKKHHHVSFSCADCDQELRSGDRGGECMSCNCWPLCQRCLASHCE